MANTPHKKNDTKRGSLDLKDIPAALAPVGEFLKQHISIIFTTAALSALMYAVINVNTVLQLAADSSQTATSAYDARFDKTTIDKIEALSQQEQSGSTSLPTGRINPFSE